MQKRSRSIFTITVLIAYIILQFLWWETLLVKQATQISDLQQKLTELNSADSEKIRAEVSALQHKKQMRIYMIAGEGTVFLLLLLFGIYKVRKSYERENQLIRQQKNFLLSVTHELKTPIAATKLQLQTILKHQHLDPEKQRQLLNHALNETNRLNRLIEDVLLANQAESGHLKLNKEATNLSELVNDTVQNYFSERITNGELKLNIEKNIQADVDRLFFPSVPVNLIENAIKYSFDKPNVAVSLKQHQNRIQLTVSDQGVGIPESEKDRVFQKFFRIGNEDTRNSKGTGLGLYIVKKIVDAHDGKIQISDNAPKGTSFIISI
jgi:two-component system, OmpR family, sensor histidine kinase CiaH